MIKSGLDDMHGDAEPRAAGRKGSAQIMKRPKRYRTDRALPKPDISSATDTTEGCRLAQSIGVICWRFLGLGTRTATAAEQEYFLVAQPSSEAIRRPSLWR
jgi:hypothetical protein